MDENEFPINPDEIKDLVKGLGYSIVSNMIIKQGKKVGFMYREEAFDEEDSGWRFLSGEETQEYLDDDENSKAIAVNAVANFDPAVIPYLRNKAGTAWERDYGTDNFAKYEEE